MKPKRSRIRSMVSLFALTSVFTVGGVAASGADPICARAGVGVLGHDVGPLGPCIATEWGGVGVEHGDDLPLGLGWFYFKASVAFPP